ncbi:MAG: glycosyltransferase family 39 protein [Acidipropionibacterium sp.]|jgi:4-amino-4-deoxy-L-arabinose transferase-like glycosyltransferase|nr:glycosyltransferase family 39 protein [Acidipropionibacterium sp.]
MTSIPSRDAFPRRAVPPSIDEHDSDPAGTERQPPWYIRIFTGRREDPRWARPALWGLILISAFLYLYKLSISGYANEFYAASVKSATQSWRAWLWASLDSQLSITVDKPPAAIWVMGLSARIFGFSSFSMLLPNALMGVATVGLTYGAVRRLSGHAAGLIAGAVVVITPVAALMFRFNNPDAMLVLCVTAAIYMVVRALQTDRGRTAVWWMVGAGWLIGLGFLTKMLQGLLVLPALALVYLLCARTRWWTRIWHLLAAAASMIVSAGWLIALCAVWPASSRPYIGGSENNSLWELAIGYNGLGRVLGGSGNGGGGGGAGGAGGGNASFGGEAGLLRMVNSSFATEISWLIPAAVLLLVTGLVARGRRPLSDRKRAGIILWGGSMILTALVFSFMQGTIHPYYSVALAPLIGGTIGSAGAAPVAR